jgi:hypothetical protein
MYIKLPLEERILPIYHRSNNRILPPNSRTVDVAKRSLKDIIPVQQRKYANAFEVQGYETIVYQRLWHGRACSCQDHRGASASYLDSEGKLNAGVMDSLLSGGLEFKVNRYGAQSPVRPDLRVTPSRFQDGQVMDGDQFGKNPAYDIVSDDIDDIFATTVTSEDVVGVNGLSTSRTLDEASEIFDGEAMLNDTKCGMCFGSGYIGGFSVLNGQRMILHTRTPDISNINGTIEYNQVPHAFYASTVEFSVMLPKGVVGLDVFRVWRNDKMVYPENLLIDGLPFSNALLIALCDGRSHQLTIGFNEMSYFTHVEMQFNLSRVQALFELPRLSGNSNMSLQDATDDLSINASPAIPMLKREDVLVESTFGKALIVASCNPWNDRDRNVLGWDVQTRVIQPAELLNHLPRRKVLDQKSTFMVRDNMSGGRRT